LDKRTLKGKIQYLVKWVGYPLHDATWEPVNHLKNTQQKVKDFERGRSNS
jgi:Chromo (CHRromatin Organisation MOdifier) domain